MAYQLPELTISSDELAQRIEKLINTDRPRYRRLWNYYRNPLQVTGVSSDDGGSGLFIRTDIVAEQIALPGHAKIEGANIAKETIQELSANRIAGKSAGALSEDIGPDRWRAKVFQAKRPVQAAVTTCAASHEE